MKANIYCNRIEHHKNYYNSESTVGYYPVEILSGLSQFFNSLIGGSSNHTLAADSYRLKRKVMLKVLDFVFSPIEKNHCKKSYYYDVTRARVALELHERCTIT